MLTDSELGLFLNVRDPVLDSYVFAGPKVSFLPAGFLLPAINRVSNARWPDATIWLDVDPELALDRIAMSYGERAKYGAQAHENVATLHQMHDSYHRAMDAMSRTSTGQVVRIDASRPALDVAADVQNVLDDITKKR